MNMYVCELSWLCGQMLGALPVLVVCSIGLLICMWVNV